MKTTKEIEEKIKHFEQQKESLAKVSSLENAKEHFEVITLNWYYIKWFTVLIGIIITLIIL